MDFFGLILALAGGAVGNGVGKSPAIGGKTKWNRALAPAAALGTSLVYKQITGADLPVNDLMVQGGQLAGSAVATYTTAKNLLQLGKSIFGR